MGTLILFLEFISSYIFYFTVNLLFLKSLPSLNWKKVISQYSNMFWTILCVCYCGYVRVLGLYFTNMCVSIYLSYSTNIHTCNMCIYASYTWLLTYIRKYILDLFFKNRFVLIGAYLVLNWWTNEHFKDNAIMITRAGNRLKFEKFSKEYYFLK